MERNNDQDFTIRKAVMADISSIMPVYDSARAFMRQNGNRTQWTGGYPQRELIESDIRQGNFYIGEKFDPDGMPVLAGVFCFVKGPDPTYNRIEDGKWPNDRPYYVIHRIASLPGIHGFAAFCFDWCLERHPVLRVDTHADNAVMRHLMEKNGFVRCGIIRVADGTGRIAFQKESC